MSSLFRKFMVALTGVVILASVASRQPFAQTPVESPYVGADACKDCHSGQFAS